MMYVHSNNIIDKMGKRLPIHCPPQHDLWLYTGFYPSPTCSGSRPRNISAQFTPVMGDHLSAGMPSRHVVVVAAAAAGLEPPLLCSIDQWRSQKFSTGHL